ncbi:MAG: type I glutamate--ammonia ligase [Thermoprotei archaeon]
MTTKTRIMLLYTDLAGVLRGVEKPYNRESDDINALFDASSVYGFEEIENSDLELRLPRDRVKQLPWDRNTYAGIASIYRASGERYIKDPRFIAERARDYIENLGYRVYIGVELEFFLFKNIELTINYDKQLLKITAPEIRSSYTIPPRKGYQVVNPVDEVAEIRKKIIDAIEELGYRVVKSHHEVASSGQVEVTLNHMKLLDTCDAIVWSKYSSRNTAWRHGYTVVFLPKPLPSDNGSGMHMHISLHDLNSEKNLFIDSSNEYGLSDAARYFIGGLIEHGRSLSALVSPTVNSYKRLIPGFEAPTTLAWGIGNRSVAIRIPSLRSSKKIEYRPPDPMANPYLAIPAIILAGLDGIKKKIEPPPPLSDNAYKYSIRELEKMGYKSLPRSLDEALDELECDHEYLKPVFPKEVIESYIEIKRREARELQSIPSPAEYQYYMYW